MLFKKDKLQGRWEVAIRCVLGILYTGFGDMRTYWFLRSKRTIFDRVREISILLFIKFFTVFLSAKNATIRMRGGHVLCNCVGYPRPYIQGLNTLKTDVQNLWLAHTFWSLISYWKIISKAISRCTYLRSRHDFYPVILFISMIWLRLAVFAEPHQTFVAFLNSFILMV